MNIRRIATHALSVAACAGLLLGPATASATDRSRNMSPATEAPKVPQTTEAVPEPPKKAKKVRKRRRSRKRLSRDARRQARHDKKLRKIARRINKGTELKAIDRAYDAGALTWDEAKGLYAEQGMVRRAVANNRDRKTGSIKRVRFIRDTAKTSLIRLKHNLVQRIYVAPAEPSQPEGERAVAQTDR